MGTGTVSLLVSFALYFCHNYVEALNVKLSGLNYNPRQGFQYQPDSEACKKQRHINEDIAALSKVTSHIRIYSLVDCNQGPMVWKAMKQVNMGKNLTMKLWLGLWVDTTKHFQKEKQALVNMTSMGLIDDMVSGINVGSEAVFRKDITVAQAVQNVQDVKKILARENIDIPVAIADVTDSFLAHPKLVEATDIVCVNLFPFWEKTPIKNSGKHFLSRITPLFSRVGSKKIIVTDTGWSSQGKHNLASTASPENQVEYFRQFYKLAAKYKWEYFYFSSFDAIWKRNGKDSVEPYFGIFNADRTMKIRFRNLNIKNDTSEDLENSKQGGSNAGKRPQVPTSKSVKSIESSVYLYFIAASLFIRT